MRAVVQRVLSAEVRVGEECVARIGPGLLTLLGVARGDDLETAERLVAKILRLRVFEDSEGRMNRSLQDSGGEHLLVSQFTLLADTTKGNRPGFAEAAAPDEARRLYEHALKCSEDLGVRTFGGRFQAEMKVSLVNDGPATFVLEAAPSP